MKRLTIVIATESSIVEFGLKALLSGINDIHAETLQVAPSEITLTIQRLRPSVVIADLCDATAVEQLRIIKNESSHAGALIGIYHSAIPQSTIRCVDATISIYDDRETLRNTLKGLVNTNQESTPSDLTPREREVIRGIVKGLSNKEIASEINVSVNTVMTHRRNIASKLKIHSPAGLTIFAIVSKIVSLEEIKDQVGAIND